MKTFHYGEYYSLLSEAQVKINMINAKRNSELEKLKSVTAEDLQKSVDEVIYELERAKETILKK